MRGFFKWLTWRLSNMSLKTSALDILIKVTNQCERRRSAIYITQASYFLLSEYFVLFRQLSDTTVSPPARLRVLVRKDSAERKTATLFHFHPVSLSLSLSLLLGLWIFISGQSFLWRPLQRCCCTVSGLRASLLHHPFLSRVLSFSGHFWSRWLLNASGAVRVFLNAQTSRIYLTHTKKIMQIVSSCSDVMMMWALKSLHSDFHMM